MKNGKEKPAVIFSHYVKYFGSNQRVCIVLQVGRIWNTSSILIMAVKRKNPLFAGV